MRTGPSLRKRSSFRDDGKGRRKDAARQRYHPSVPILLIATSLPWPQPPTFLVKVGRCLAPLSTTFRRLQPFRGKDVGARGPVPGYYNGGFPNAANPHPPTLPFVGCDQRGQGERGGTGAWCVRSGPIVLHTVLWYRGVA